MNHSIELGGAGRRTAAQEAASRPSVNQASADASQTIEPTQIERFLSSRQMAEVLGLSPYTIRRQACEGRLPAHKLNGRLLFRWSEVRERITEKVITDSLEGFAKAIGQLD